MNKYKVIVYAISKNEEKFVNRWVDSMSEADEIYVMDTGSSDKTISLLKNRNVNVITKIINPWRFDIARNESLKLIPNDTDICVCTDLDEIFISGWRIELEKVWTKNTTRCRYIYNWSLNENNKPKVSYISDKIHSLNNYEWVNPVHEVLKNKNNEIVVLNKNIILNHYPDSTKSRSSYLNLLKLAIKENPNNDRNMHYLGREYMYNKKWNKAIDTLIKHLKLNSSTWKDERCASMRFISRCYIALNRYDEAELWLDKAIKEAPYLRDPYIEKSLLFYRLKNFKEVIKNCNKALKITTHEMTYINEIFSWNETIYDLLSIAYFNEGKYELSLRNINKALKINPKDSRLLNNKKIIKYKIKR